MRLWKPKHKICKAAGFWLNWTMEQSVTTVESSDGTRQIQMVARTYIDVYILRWPSLSLKGWRVLRIPRSKQTLRNQIEEMQLFFDTHTCVEIDLA